VDLWRAVAIFPPVNETRYDDPRLLEAVRGALSPLVPPRARGRIAPAASLIDDLGMDSLKVVELTMRLERALGRPVFLPEWIASVDDPAQLTVGSLVAFLARDSRKSTH
jgi:acyl carrier protein